MDYSRDIGQRVEGSYLLRYQKQNSLQVQKELPPNNAYSGVASSGLVWKVPFFQPTRLVRNPLKLLLDAWGIHGP